ncbi:MAG: trehalose-phosphatase [Caulobacter sp.]|nr:trehalose-phosphatase [Caulobacter sp.]
MIELSDVRLEVPSEAPPGLDLARTSLFLDLDGTLAPIEATPDAVRPEPLRTETLKALGKALSGRMAVLSGRPISEVDAILEGAVPNVAGQHGLERRCARDGLHRTPPHPALAEAGELLDGFASADRGLLVERKSAAVAIHYRASPTSGPAVLELVRRLAKQHDLVLQEGRMVAELRTPGPDKGEALRAFMAIEPFSGGAPLMIGDDLTDEDAFASAVDLGGAAILVGPPRPSLARWRLSSPDALLAWLGAAIPTQQPLPFREIVS